MLRKAIFTFWVLCAALLSHAVLADNDPTLHQVYQAAEAGRLNEAQGMMNKVLQDHPNSAKAHFVEAELLAKQGLLSKAEIELNTAERLAPGLPFANPQSVQDLKNRIGSTHAVGQPASSDSFPWVGLIAGIGLIVLIFVIIRSMNSRGSTYFPANPQPSMQNAPGYPPYGAGGAGTMAPTGGIGSNIMGGLATGAAVGVGMVAGEALAHHLLDGDRSANPSSALAGDWNTSSSGVGGADFGIADNSSWDDSSSIAGNMDSGDGGWT
jgi:hypothetical protein